MPVNPAPQIVDGVSGGIEAPFFYFVLLCLEVTSDFVPEGTGQPGLRPLPDLQPIMLADQIRTTLAFAWRSGPVLRGGFRAVGLTTAPPAFALLPGGRSARHHILASFTLPSSSAACHSAECHHSPYSRCACPVANARGVAVFGI